MKLNRYKKINDLFSSFEFDVIDIQEDDPSVGIYEGWVIYEMRSTGLQYELRWSEANYCKTKEQIEQASRIYTEN